jgi:hypothetical protein
MKFLRCLLLFVLVFSLEATSSTIPTANSEDGDDGFIHLHIIPHTHNDAGWLYTVNSYFKGDNPRGCVECILNNITQSLQVNPERRFVYVEQVYFQEWWEEISDSTRQTVLKLINNGQLDFLLAGYVMNDEACAYYDDMVEQITLGHRFIKSNFNRTVSEAWHIDPFGHSATQARLFSEMGFNAWFFERIDYQDFDTRLRNRNLETIWRPNSYDPSTNFIFAHVNYMPYYLAPFNWCIDMLCYPEPNLPEVVRKALAYVKWVKNQTNFYPTKHIMHHVGGDFEWSGNTPNHYEGLETLIHFLNSHPSLGIKAYFSTPHNYSNSVYEEIRKKNITLSEKSDDFFPYQDVPHAYWSGFFSSKPSMKGMIRTASKYLQAARKILAQFLVQKKLTFSDFNKAVYEFERSLSILQHHDAVTGTAKHSVDLNYTAILEKGYSAIHDVLFPLIKAQFVQEYEEQISDLSACRTTSSGCNSIQGELTDGSNITAFIYNPSQIVTRNIRIEVPSDALTIKDEAGNEVPVDIFCDQRSISVNVKKMELLKAYASRLKMSPQNLLRHPAFLERDVLCEAFFTAVLAPNAFKSYQLVSKPSMHPQPADISGHLVNKGTPQIVELFRGETLLVDQDLKSFVYVTPETKNTFTLDYKYYTSYYNGSEQASGVYIFRPNENVSLEYSRVRKMNVQKGNQVIEVKIERDLVVTRLRFFKNTLAQTIEIETFLLPVPIDDQIGKEVTIEIGDTEIKNQGVFYTDSNGLEMQKRVVNYRPTYKVDILEPVAGNYYPINSAIYIEDTQTQQRMTLMNDRSQGGASLKDGSIEIMIHRRILHDDNRGVEEPLNETTLDGEGVTVSIKHWLFFSKGPEKQRQMQYDLDTLALIYVAKTSGSPIVKTQQVVGKEMNTVNYVKFYIRPYDDNQILLRFHNVLEDKNATLKFWSKETGLCYALEELLGVSYDKVKIQNVIEVTLDTVQEKQQMLKKKFSWDGKYQFNQPSDSFENILLKPLEERAFILII